LLQYSFDDFTISQVAQLLGKEEDAKKYQNRSKGFELVWNPETVLQQQDTESDLDVEVKGIKGFMQVGLGCEARVAISHLVEAKV
jgi:putative alpha-1,2-mannosidase